MTFILWTFRKDSNMLSKIGNTLKVNKGEKDTIAQILTFIRLGGESKIKMRTQTIAMFSSSDVGKSILNLNKNDNPLFEPNARFAGTENKLVFTGDLLLLTKFYKTYLDYIKNEFNLITEEPIRSLIYPPLPTTNIGGYPGCRKYKTDIKVDQIHTVERELVYEKINVFLDMMGRILQIIEKDEDIKSYFISKGLVGQTKVLSKWSREKITNEILRGNLVIYSILYTIIEYMNKKYDTNVKTKMEMPCNLTIDNDLLRKINNRITEQVLVYMKNNMQYNHYNTEIFKLEI